MQLHTMEKTQCLQQHEYDKKTDDSLFQLVYLSTSNLNVVTMNLLSLLLGIVIFHQNANAQFSCNDFHFGFCDISLGGVIDSFSLPYSESAISVCQSACKVKTNIPF